MSDLVHSGAQESAVIPTCDGPKTVADILAAAADLIEPEGRWTQHAFSRDKRGDAKYGAGRWAAEPVCWCAIGAIAYVQQKTPDEAIRDGAHMLLEGTVGESVAFWNDAPKRTQTEVVSALRAAAEKARTAAQSGSVGTSGASEP